MGSRLVRTFCKGPYLRDGTALDPRVCGPMCRPHIPPMCGPTPRVRGLFLSVVQLLHLPWVVLPTDPAPATIGPETFCEEVGLFSCGMTVAGQPTRWKCSWSPCDTPSPAPAPGPRTEYVYQVAPCVNSVERQFSANAGFEHLFQSSCASSEKTLGVGGGAGSCTRSLSVLVVQFLLPQVSAPFIAGWPMYPPCQPCQPC